MNAVQHNAISMLSLCVSEACTQSVGACPFIFCVLVIQEKQDDSSLPDCVCAQSLTAHVVGKNCDYACSVVRQHACNHLSAGMDAVKDHKGEHLPHQTVPQLQQRGGCWRRCTGRRLTGNGFSVWEQFVPGVCFLFPQMSLCNVVSAVGVAELLSSLCVLLLCFSCFLKGNRCLALSNVCVLFSS